jgi:LacI family transcriptional regulator
MQTVFQSVLPPEQRSIGFQPVRRARVPAKRVRAFAWIHKQDASRGIEDVAQKHGYSLFLCNSDDDQQKALNYLQLLRKHRIAGLIAAFQPREPTGHRILQSLLDHRVPVVLMGSRRPDQRIVMLTEDDEHGTFLATSHLLDPGHRRIGTITPPAGGEVEKNRVAGFLKAHASRSIHVASELVVPGGFDVSDGQRGVSVFMRLRKPPTAIVAANDLVAIGSLNLLCSWPSAGAVRG